MPADIGVERSENKTDEYFPAYRTHPPKKDLMVQKTYPMFELYPLLQNLIP